MWKRLRAPQQQTKQRGKEVLRIHQCQSKAKSTYRIIIANCRLQLMIWKRKHNHEMLRGLSVILISCIHAGNVHRKHVRTLRMDTVISMAESMLNSTLLMQIHGSEPSKRTMLVWKHHPTTYLRP